MKHYKLNNLIGDLQNVKMTPAEKTEVLSRSWSAIEKIEAAHQFSIGTGRIAEVGKKDLSVKKTIQTAWYTYFMEKKFVPAMSFALLLLATGGTSLAAERSLPGDLLYPVKIGLNEQVRGFTAVTPEAKAKFALEVTDRRLNEVAILSSRGLLNAETSAIIQEQLLRQAGQIKNQVASLVSTKNIRAAQEISLNFESSLRAHELILEKISTQQAAQTALATNTGVNAASAKEKTDTATTADPTIVSASSSATSSGSLIAVAPSASSISRVATMAPLATSQDVHIASLIATIKNQIESTTATRTLIQANEAKDDLNRDKILARLAEIKLKAVEIKRIASTTPISSSVRASTSLSYIAESDSLISTASLKVASSSYADALLDLQRAGQYLIDAETLISAEYSSDPALNALINEALSLPNFSQANSGVASSTPPVATSTLDISTSSTASSTDSSTNSGATVTSTSAI